MAGLFIATIPSRENTFEQAKEFFPYIKPEVWYSHLLLRKLVNEFEVNLEKLFAQYNLSMSRFTIMTLLFMRPKGLTPSELAEHMNVSQATTSGLLHNLEKEEIIERMSHAKDGRSYLICLSKKGKELADIIFPLYHGRLNEFWRDFSEEEKNHTFSCIEKLLDRVSDLSSPVVKK